jgi:hypothetical protein
MITRRRKLLVLHKHLNLLIARYNGLTRSDARTLSIRESTRKQIRRTQLSIQRERG